ncbi:hypothetical protein SteCoe_13962 [Stentor coeruleus]|uniref:Ubiquitin-related modifier 1 homolog n=1 Tax=Stentor coeruleus TaxID=5963 RepID=A0A1R2C744_9CILI|nr:hypothetical protein SteCoe_13962 [Stentor coeruleus]
MVQVFVDFSGGLEDLFGRQKELQVNIEEMTLRQLVFHLKDRYVQMKPELFVTGDGLRPGIIVLVNDTDWELLGKDSYQVQNQDRISFISTLHGG